MHREIWAVPGDRICAFFEEKPEIQTEKNGSYRAPDAEISVFPLPDKKTGPVFLPQTEVLFEGPGAEELYREFCLRFLSAGG